MGGFFRLGLRSIFVPEVIASDIKTRTRWHIKIRWLFLLSIAAPGVLSELIPQGLNETVIRDILLALGVLSSNAIFYAIARSIKKPGAFKALAILLLVVDIATITYLIFTKGGIESRSPILYTIPILLSSVVFGRRGLHMTTLASIVMYDGLITLDWLDVIHSIGAVSPQLRQDFPYVINTVAFFTSALFIIGLLIDFVISLIDAEQRRAITQSKALAQAQAIGHIGSWAWDMRTNKITWSDELYRIFGIDPAHFKAKYESYLSLVHTKDRETANTIIQNSARSKEPFKFDHRIKKSDGTIRWIHSEGVVETDKQGNAVKMTGIAQDITEKKHDEEALRHQAEELEKTKQAILNILEDLQSQRDSLQQTNAKYEALLASISSGVVATDSKGTVVFVNNAALDMLGLAGYEVLEKRWGKDLPGVVDGSGAPIPAAARLLDGPLKRAEMATVELSDGYYFVKAGGTFFPVTVTVSPIKHDDKVTGSVIVFRDATREKEIDEAKTEFVSIASHQLRTPATGVKQVLGLALEGYAGKFSKTQQDFLEKAYSANERALSLIEDLLNIARLDSGKLQVTLTPGDVRVPVKKAVESQIASFEEHKQKLQMHLPKQPLKAKFDSEKLEMVIENLLTNATKYTPDGGTIDVTVSKTKEDVEISVADNGIGISKEDNRKLFQKFARIDSELSRERGGSGIGLYLVKKIIDMHQGKIEVKSKPSQGSTFTVKLPTRNI